MAYDGSRRKELPSNWSSTIVPRILKRDGYRCTFVVQHGDRCPETTRLEVNHKGDRLDHSDAALETLCHYHHAQFTGKQSAEARVANRKAMEAKFSRGEHPGEIDGRMF